MMAFWYDLLNTVGTPEYRVRTLYPYDGQRAEELCTSSFRHSVRHLSLICFVAFGENLVLTAYASKTGGDWWYGTVVSSGNAGLIPKTYVQIFETGESFYC